MNVSTWPISCPQHSAKRCTMASAFCKAWTRSSQHLLPRVSLLPSPESSLNLASRSPFPVRCLADTASHMPGQAGVAHQATSAPALSGRIDVIFGPMFAGKSSELLKRVEALENAGKKTTLVKSDRDTRYSKNEIATHDGIARRCHAVNTLAELRSAVGESYESVDVIAIDEAQFFPDLLDFCTEASDHDNKQVLVAGLDGDFKRQRFGQVLDLIPVSDSVTKLTADCAYCGQPALFSLRIAADQRQEVVGGADKYAPVCRHHYVSLSQLRGS